ncbi:MULTISPECIES: spore germination protein [Bacillaceae]|uniref:Spore gernimation protein KB n=1 Tax=Domibacillus aminovorans TaxID=29332 RepID=A0A177KYG4_9BACI|nr:MULTISPECIES: spore germination protein [Bacillaceae]OAH58045.1 spore gernimation protein KB [Domibacillus aminovorans]
MFSFFKQKKQQKNRVNPQQPKEEIYAHKPSIMIDFSLSKNLEDIKRITGNSPDIVIRKVKIGDQAKIDAAVLFVKGLVDSQAVNDLFIESIMKSSPLQENLDLQGMMELIADKVIPLGQVQSMRNQEEIVGSLMAGNTIILIDGIDEALSAGTQGGEKRSIQEPTTHVSIRGSKEGFTETNETNIAMVRRIIKSPDVWVESMTIGKMTKTDVSIMYLKGIAKEDIVEEVRTRLKRIDIDGILESGYIEQLIEDQTMTPFPTIENTERPDMVAGNLLSGRIAIFINGTPFVLLVPAIFVEFFQTFEDYSSRFDIANGLRLLRVLAFFISLVGPALYVGATTFHQEMIPTQLVFIIAAQREAVPFPAVVEALIMELTFEILREAGLRLPKAIGSTVSIVGALVIGQAAVQAGIVSPAMVIVVSITAIASFATPAYGLAISARLIRFAFIISAATFGFFGLILAFFLMIVHLCSLRSFGVPYMTPFAPFFPTNFKETFFRRPLWAMNERSRIVAGDNIIRQGENQKPQPPISREMIMTDQKEGDTHES